MSRPIILGGGVAGISAAVRLADAGLKPVLIESRPVLGGRVRSFRHAETGDEIDNGQHLLMGCYHDTLRLLERLGTRNSLELQPALSVEFRDLKGNRSVLTAPTGIPAPLDVLIAMLRFRSLSFSERLGLIRLGISAKLKEPRPDETVGHYLERLGQSPQARTWLWDPIILATLNTPAEEASAKLFSQIMRLAFLGTGQDSRLGIPRSGLSDLFGIPAERYITEKGGEVITGEPVRYIEREGQQFHVTTKNGTIFTTDRLLAALPWRGFQMLVRPLISKGPDTTPQEIAHNPIISIYLWFDQDLRTIPEFAAMVGGTVEWVFNRRKILPEQNALYPGLLCCVTSAADATVHQESTALINTAEQELRKAFPELGSARLLTAQVIKEKQATFAATPDTEKLRLPESGILPGLFLAGDWTKTDLPGTIEGAVRSGFRAAEAILD